MVVMPHLLQYTLVSNIFLMSRGMSAHSFAAGRVKGCRNSTVIVHLIGQEVQHQRCLLQNCSIDNTTSLDARKNSPVELSIICAASGCLSFIR